MTTVCWTSYTEPSSIVNVGMDAIAMLCDDIIWFYDLKKQTVLYYKADNPTQGAGMARLVGHNRFPLFAFVEAVLQPSIFIMKYPEMTKYAIFKTRNVTAYLDLRFSEHDHFLALSGYPKYTLRIWNYRTQTLLAETNTYRKASVSSLRCSANTVPQILQVCQWQVEIAVWELCFSTDNYAQLHEVSLVKLGKDYTEGICCSTNYWDDGNIYVVNDYGALYSLDIAQFYLRNQWSPPVYHREQRKPRRHALTPQKFGFIIMNPESAYFVRRKNYGWSAEWTIDNTIAHIEKIRANFHNEIYAINNLGDVYRVEPVGDQGTLVPVHVHHSLVVDYFVLKGIKEEGVLVLTTTCQLSFMEALRLSLYSQLELPQATGLCVHNALPFAALVTAVGFVHIVSYEKPRAPLFKAEVEVLANVHLVSLRWNETSMLVEEQSNKQLHLLYANCKDGLYSLVSSLPPWGSVQLLRYILYDETHVLTLMDRDTAPSSMTATSAANELWTHALVRQLHKVHRAEFQLPFKCRAVTVLATNKDLVEIFAVRDCDSIIDQYNLVDNTELTLVACISTHHYGHVAGISGTRNLYTWGVDGTICHFRSHKKATRPYMISRSIQQNYAPRVMRCVEEICNNKFLVVHHSNGCLECHRLPSLSDNARENMFLEAEEVGAAIPAQQTHSYNCEQQKQLIIMEVSQEQREERASIEAELRVIEGEVRRLIDYDMSVTGRSSGIFRKFCLNTKWLRILNSEARQLFDLERKFLQDSTADQARIRDWIMTLISSTSGQFSTKLRAIFSNSILENYALRKPLPTYMKIYDLYRFYDMEPIDDEDSAPQAEESIQDDDDLAVANQTGAKAKKRYVIQGSSVYDHTMSEEFYVQDRDNVTANQMHNDDICFRAVLQDALKKEFNKMFTELRLYKQEMMDQVLNTNTVLNRIYDNMNCMLRLLQMDQFALPVLTVPEWMRDEVIERILTVDDSEIKAINRRKQAKLVAAHKSGRMLLWAVEFWIGALNTMMDGVLEKLWEEEIKKTPPPPDFMLKKQEHEYSLEEVKLWREYEERLRLLKEDRRKYLRILHDNENKTLNLKGSYIMKVNERCAELAILKLNYDYALRHIRIRLLSTKYKQFQRVEWRKKVVEMRKDIDRMTEYIVKYTKLSDFWEKAALDTKSKLENLQLRDKSIEKEFKSKFLNTIPSQFTQEMAKLFKRRPKISPRSFNSVLVCMEVAAHISQKTPRVEFPLAIEVMDYMRAMDALDDIKNCPNQLEARFWETFVKMRRQKLESELRIKGVGYQLLDAQNGMNSFIKDVAGLKTTKTSSFARLNEIGEEYFNSVQDQAIQLTLTMGQVEVPIAGSLSNLKNSILMHVNDVNEVNDLIKKAGEMKLKSMQRVACFRRQVIYKEWEHQVVRANIDYLKYMLNVIEKCKVSMEFLDILRNWDRVQANKAATTNSVGLIERVIEEKIAAYRKNLERILEKIDIVKEQIKQMQRRNRQVDRQINEVKVTVTFATVNRDVLAEEKRTREQSERMATIKTHRCLIDTVRRDYAHILELNTILELQRLRTYPTLGPAPPQCL